MNKSQIRIIYRNSNGRFKIRPEVWYLSVYGSASNIILTFIDLQAIIL